ncbi:hypothetical protein ACH5RR_036013 [Cinchona calisaya]|uniref:Pentatricopeptide repeat-containing protein n=1 Tax=Cinchona calisaya TaxID=153742 RepID=A0ABD2Y5J6_9GENT
MITGLMQNGLEKDAVNIFWKMIGERLAADQFTFGVGASYCLWRSCGPGKSQNGYSEEAIHIFCETQRNGIEQDEFALGSAISSCANLASLEEGGQFHA